METTNYTINIGNVKTRGITKHKLVVEETRNDTSSHIMWIVELDFLNEKMLSQKNFNLSGAIDEIRERIESKGYLLIIKWCEKDANQSGMLGDSTAGARMYKMEEVVRINEEGEKIRGYPSYDILSPSEFNKVVNLSTQKAYVRFLLEME